MPSERERHGIEALSKALPDLGSSLHRQVKATHAHQSALSTLGQPGGEVRLLARGSLGQGCSIAVGMGLGAKWGHRRAFRAEGADAEAALKGIGEAIAAGLGEGAH